MRAERENLPEQPAGTSKAPIVFGKYQLLGLLGKGGMAEVYLARPRAQRRLVAIKCILKNLAADKQYVDMFVREGKLSVQLNHDAIVKTYEIGRIQGRYFICMEYISGIDLTQVLRRCRANQNRRLPVPHALSIALRVCEGLHFAHELRDGRGKLLNVVNRDVSPSNIRISFDGDIKLLDFGIAKATSGLSSEIGVLKGKISHMSPEQVRGLPLDRRSDIFSSGTVLHEMLTLDKLFRGDSDFQLMDLVRRAEVRPPSAMNPRVPPEVDAIVIKALQKDPQARYQTVEEMAVDLREALARYNFSKSELRDLVRDLGRKEWTRDQKLLETSLEGETSAQAEDLLEDDVSYGEFLEVSLEAPEQPEPARRARHQQPLWIYVLLAVAVLLLVLALVLLIVFR